MNYSNSELIHRYLDGMLPENHERQLFDELARNPELRRDFGLELELHKAASCDKAALIPPGTIRSGVFSALNIPLTSDVTEIGTAASPQLLTFTSIALVSMIFGGMMVWLGMKDSSRTSEQLFTKNAVTEVHTLPVALDNSSPFPDNAISPTPATVQDISIKNSPLRTNTPQQLSAENTTQVLQPTQLLPASVLSINSNSRSTTADRQKTNDSKIFFADKLNLLQVLDIPTDIPMSVSMRGLQDLTGSGGVALSALYALDDEQSMGVEVSSAHFTHSELRKIGGKDKLVAMTEQSTVIGVAYRISLPSMDLYECIPYIQSFAGASTKGLPVARTTVGLQWTPDRRVTLSGGIDGTLYGYQANGQWKAGVMASMVYGVSVLL